MRREGHPATISDLATDLGGHPNTTRAHLAHLDHLVDEGLVERVALESRARGRPAQGRRLTDRGRLVLEAVGAARPVSTDELVSAMAEHLATTTDCRCACPAIGRLWAAQLGTEVGGALGVEARSSAGVRDHYDPARRWMRARFWGTDEEETGPAS